MMNKILYIAALAVFLILVSCDSTISSSDHPKTQLVYSNDYGRCYIGSAGNQISVTMNYATTLFSVNMEVNAVVEGNVAYEDIDIFVDNIVAGSDKESLYELLCNNYKKLFEDRIVDLKCHDNHVGGKLVPDTISNGQDLSSVMANLESSWKSECVDGIRSLDETLGRAPSVNTTTKYHVTSCEVIPTDEVIQQVITGDGFSIVSGVSVEGPYLSTGVAYTGIDSELLNQFCQSIVSDNLSLIDPRCDSQSASYTMIVDSFNVQDLGAFFIEEAQDECQKLLNGSETVEDFFLEDD